MSDASGNETIALGTAPVALTATAVLREEFLCSTFAWVLKREHVDLHEDFFALGGDSMKATLVLVQLRERLDASFSTRSFFSLRTVAKLAAAIPEGAFGLDAEEADYQGDDGFLQLDSGVHVQCAKLVASAAPSPLALEMRAYCRDNALAPSAVYLSAWLDVLANQDEPEAFPLCFRCSSRAIPGGASWCIPSVRVPDVPALQRRLLSEPAREPERSQLAQSALVYSRTPQLEPPALTLGPRGWGLVISDATTIRLDLFVARDAAAVRSPQGVLDEYLQRLAYRLSGHSGFSRNAEFLP